MTRKEAMRRNHLENALVSLGFTSDESDKLRRISLTLRRWYEHECNGALQRDEDTGKVFWYNVNTGHAPLSSYLQTDPRGATLYILRPDDVPAGQPADSCYSRGIYVY